MHQAQLDENADLFESLKVSAKSSEKRLKKPITSDDDDDESPIKVSYLSNVHNCLFLISIFLSI